MEAKDMPVEQGGFPGAHWDGADVGPSKHMTTHTCDGPTSSDGSSTELMERAKTLIRQWGTFALICGFFIAAFVLAVGHFLLFRILDGTMAENRRIDQSQITALSLLITTAFKACIISAIGMSFAQSLWRLVRQKPLQVSRIEQLFRIRSNPLDLARIRIIFEAPILFFMALSVWLIPIAAIYPPSALTVTSQPYSLMKNVSISFLNPRAPVNYDVLYPDKVPYSSFALHSGVRILRGGPKEEVERLGGYAFSVEYYYKAPMRPLLGVAKLALLSGEIADLPSPAGQNSSYSLEFEGPQLSCEESIRNVSESSKLISTWTLFNTTWRWNELTIRQTDFYGRLDFASFCSNDISVDILTPLSTSSYPRMESSAINSTFTFLGVSKTLRCTPQVVKYHLNVSYANGLRNIEYSKLDSKPVLFPGYVSCVFPRNSTLDPNITHVPVETAKFKEWEIAAKNVLYGWNIYALLDASMQSMKYNWTQININYGSDANFILENGTQVAGNIFRLDPDDKSYPAILETSIFNPQRFNDSRDIATFDPRTDLVFTETKLNDFITNVTISALGLNIWKNVTMINTTEYRSTYQFSEPLNLVLPYALSLAFAVVFVGIGAWSLIKNGAPAVDGGFLQVMSSTTGRTEMEKLVSKYHAEGGDIPKELMGMKIRYGELIDNEGVGTGVAGFGTVEETRPLRRGWTAG